MVMVNKSFDFEMAMTLGCNFYQDTSRPWCLAPLCQIPFPSLWDGW